MKQPKLNKLKIDRKGTLAMRDSLAKSGKIKITINFDADVLDEVKKMASDSGSPYQTLLNKIIRDSVAKKREEESRLDRLEKEIKNLKKKIA